MPIYLQGIQVSTNAAITSLKEGIKTNVTSHPFYGSDVVEIEQVSISERNISFTMLLRKDDMLSNEQVEFIVNNIQGVVNRLTPLHLHCDEHPLYGGSNDLFIVLDTFDADWQPGTLNNGMIAVITFNGKIIGTPGNLFGVYGLKSQRRTGDFTGTVPGRSTIGLPYFGAGFIVGCNIPFLELRNATQMLNLGDAAAGFVSDLITQVVGEVQMGEVRFNIDVSSNNFAANGVRTYDEGYTPRKRVYSKTHEFLGDISIENELYKITMRVGSSTIDFYQSTGPNGTYAGTPFETITTTNTFNKVNITINTDEIVRAKMNSGDYLEMERGKDAVFALNSNDGGFTYQLGSGAVLSTYSGVSDDLTGLIARFALDETSGNVGSNILTDSDFESYGTSPGPPSGWNHETGNTSQETKETTLVHLGLAALKVTPDGSATTFCGVNQTLTVVAGHSYYIEAWARTDGNALARPSLVVKNSTDNVNFSAVLGTAAGVTYEKLTTTFNPIAGKTYIVRLGCAAITSGTGSIYWDDIVVKEIVATDSISANNGTLFGGTNTKGPIVNVTAKYSSGYQFNGVDEYISVPDAAAYSITTTNQFSMVMWLKRGALTQGQLIGKASNPFEYAVGIDSTNKVKVELWNTTGSSVASLTSTGTIADTTTFHQVVVTVSLTSASAGTINIYIDAKLDATSTFSSGNSLSNTASNLFIGWRGSSGGTSLGWFNGIIDEVKLYNVVLTQTQIAHQYNLPTPLQAAGQAQNWVQTNTNVYVSSNYEFNVLAKKVAPLVTGTLDQVYSLIYFSGTFNTSGRFKEILKEIS